MYGTFGAEELPASVTVVCDVCGRTVTTRVSGNTTRCPERAPLTCEACGHHWLTGPGESGTVHCPECSHPHDVQAGCGNPIVIPTGSTRPPVTVDCYACGHEWGTRAREGSTVRCPSCKHPRRVPTGARDRIDPGAPRVYREEPAERPAPRDYRPAESGRGLLGSLAGLFRAGAPDDSRRIDCLHCSHRWRTTAAPGNSIRCPKCRRPRRVPTTDRPAPARTTQAPAAAAPRPAHLAPVLPLRAPSRPPAALPAPGGPRPGPIDPQTLTRAEQDRRDSVCQVVRSLSVGFGLLVWYNQPPGYCEALDTNRLPEEQRCPHRATHAVRYTQGATDTHAFACTQHTGPLAALAQRSPYVTATVHPLRAR